MHGRDSLMVFTRDSHTSSEKQISLKLEKLARETRSQWSAVPSEGGVTPFLLFGAILEEFLACKAGWELRNSSFANQTEKFFEKLLSSAVSSAPEDKKRHSRSILRENKLCLPGNAVRTISGNCNRAEEGVNNPYCELRRVSDAKLQMHRLRISLFLTGYGPAIARNKLQARTLKQRTRCDDAIGKSITRAMFKRLYMF